MTAATGHGGAREGAGRPLGSASQRTREIADQCAREGLTPLEVMIANMKRFLALAEAAEEDLARLTTARSKTRIKRATKMQVALLRHAELYRVRASECARDAARFIHPYLSSVELKADVRNRGVPATGARVRDELKEIFGDALARGAAERPARGNRVLRKSAKRRR